VLAYHASRDLVPLFSVYALLFADHGVDSGRISLLFIIWSVTSFVCEVPSGAWADTFDRRRLHYSCGGRATHARPRQPFERASAVRRR